jgi:hypothetical protein
MAIYYYIQVLPKGGLPAEGGGCPGAIIIEPTSWVLSRTERHFGRRIEDVCNYHHPYQLKPEDRDWMVRCFGKDGQDEVEIDVFVPPFFLGQYHDYKRGNALDLSDFGARYVSGICCGGKEAIIGRKVKLAFGSFDYYLTQDTG